MLSKLLIIGLVLTFIISSAYALDTDGDGLDDASEEALGTGVNDMDTDKDGFTDGVEVEFGSNPLDDSKHPTNAITGSVVVELPAKNYLVSLLVITVLSQIGLFMYIRSRNEKFN
jgi:hypothetical protein